MRLTREQKKERVRHLAHEVKAATHLVFADYQGVNFAGLCELRRGLRSHRCGLRIVKNTLFQKALKEAEVSVESPEVWNGPVAVLFSQAEDPLPGLKELARFGKDYPQIKVKGGVVFRRWISLEDFQNLARLPSRQVLLGRLTASVAAPLSRMVNVLGVLHRDLVYVLQAIQKAKER
ncbi:MAG: 50S ribosomal protein L10 [Elusimicrobia bacterium]|nr:50S ribosomal protein L10 [Elusimicrobiota bacterium]